MRNRSSRSFVPALVSCLLAVCMAMPSAYSSQVKKDEVDNPGQKELVSYELTMDKIHRLVDSTKELKEWQDKNPQQAKELNESPLGDSSSITQQTKLIDSKLPQASAIIKKHGFSTREYLVALYAFIQSSVIVGMKKSGQAVDTSKMTDVVSPGNVDLVEKNWAEISKLNASMQ